MMPTEKQRVLVIDDLQDAADSMKMLLEIEGFETRAAYSGSVALGIAAEFKPSVIVCDIGLPKMDGHAIARQLRSDPAFASATLIALTGWGAAEEIQRTKESGFDFHLVKPIDSEALVALLASIGPQ